MTMSALLENESKWKTNINAAACVCCRHRQLQTSVFLLILVDSVLRKRRRQGPDVSC